MELTKNLQIVDMGNNQLAVRIYDVEEDRFRRIAIIPGDRVTIDTGAGHIFIWATSSVECKAYAGVVIYPDYTTGKIVETVYDEGRCTGAPCMPNKVTVWKDERGNLFAYRRYKKFTHFSKVEVLITKISADIPFADLWNKVTVE